MIGATQYVAVGQHESVPTCQRQSMHCAWGEQSRKTVLMSKTVKIEPLFCLIEEAVETVCEAFGDKGFGSSSAPVGSSTLSPDTGILVLIHFSRTRSSTIWRISSTSHGMWSDTEAMGIRYQGLRGQYKVRCIK